MSTIRETKVRFLFGQNKLLVRAALLLSHLVVVVDVVTGIRSPLVTPGRLFLGVIFTELVALLVIFPGLLFLFRLIERFVVVLGPLRAALAVGMVLLLKAALAPHRTVSPFLAPEIFVDVILCALIGATLLFIVKGTQPFFPSRTASAVVEVPPDVESDSDYRGAADSEGAVFGSKALADIVPARVPMSETKVNLLLCIPLLFIPVALGLIISSAPSQEIDDPSPANIVTVAADTPGKASLEPKVELAAVTAATEERWHVLSVTGNTTSYLDTRSITRHGRLIAFSTLHNTTVRVAPAVSGVDSFEMDCPNRQYRLISMVSYSEQFAQGAVIGSSTPKTFGLENGKFYPFEPQMLDMAESACRLAGLGP